MRGARCWRTGAGLILALLAMALPARAADETLELAVTVNGYATGQIGEFIRREGQLMSRPAELNQLGLRLPAGTVTQPDGLVALADIRGLTWKFDGASQSIAFTATDRLLMPAMLDATPATPHAFRAESGLGASLNYDLIGSMVDGRTVGSGQFNARAFSPWGVLSSGFLAYAGAAPIAANGSGLIRLDSGYSFSDPGTLRRYRLGDVINSGLSWTRPVRLGGIQIQSDFSLRPDLVTFPLPIVSGAAAVPSTVDVLVNDMQVLSHQVAPGPFQVSQLPVITGADTVTTTVTNALGKQVTTTLPFYASADMLAPGLQSYSAEVGWVRQNWGLVSDDYRMLAGSATWRSGLTRFLTAEAHAEGTAGQTMGGLGLIANVFDLGTVNAALAGSVAGGHSGGQVEVGAQRLGRVFSFGVSALFANRDFRDMAAMAGDAVSRRQINANLAFSLGALGSLGLAYTGLDRDAVPAPRNLTGTGGYLIGGEEGDDEPGSDLPLPATQHADIISASWSMQMGRFSLYATGFYDAADKADNGAMLGVTVPLGPRSSASANVGTGGTGGYGQVQAMQNPVLVGDWGYQAYATTNPGHEFGEGQYKSPWGLFSLGADRLDDTTTLRGEAQGALSAADDSVFASNTIDDSFAVVDTNGVPDVAVMEENRLVGRTDSDGKILVPDLRSFDVNHISIDPNDVPPGDSLPYAARSVRPQDRSGVVVRFPITQARSALIRLTDPAGKPLPVGSTAALVPGGAPVPMGYDGEVYVEHLAAGKNRLEVVRPDGTRCRSEFDYAANPGTIPTIGPVACAGP